MGGASLMRISYGTVTPPIAAPFRVLAAGFGSACTPGGSWMVVRGRLYAGWLAVHGVLAALPITSHGRLDWPPFNAWGSHLDLNIEGALGNTYTIVLWSIVAVLALAQAVRPADGSRWLWLSGWFSLGIIAGALAAEEYAGLKGQLGLVGYNIAWLEGIHGTVIWLVVFSPPAAILGSISAYVLYTSVRRNVVLAILAGLAPVTGVAATYHEILDLNEWADVLEEGLELMTAALISVVLIELLVQHWYATTRAAHPTA